MEKFIAGIILGAACITLIFMVSSKGTIFYKQGFIDAKTNIETYILKTNDDMTVTWERNKR